MKYSLTADFDGMFGSYIEEAESPEAAAWKLYDTVHDVPDEITVRALNVPGQPYGPVLYLWKYGTVRPAKMAEKT